MFGGNEEGDHCRKVEALLRQACTAHAVKNADRKMDCPVAEIKAVWVA